jgi:hypothetical protein
MLLGPPILRLAARERPISANGCSGWPTPQSAEHQKTNKRGNLKLGGAARMAGWATPAATDGSKAPPDHHDRNLTLVGQAKLSGWPTPMAGSPATEDYNEAGNTDSSRKTVALASGPDTASSPAATEKPVAYLLNPAFSLWLQGYPLEWFLLGMKAIRNSKRR